MTRKILDVKRIMTKETDQQGWTPLHYAADMGNAVAVKQLLEFDKSAAYIADNVGKKTALLIAAGKAHIGVMKEFLSSCLDCYELVDSRGRNVLHFAVESNSNDGVQLVLENSFLSNLINEKDMEGKTPLHYVAASHTILPCLISHPKVDAMACNKQNLSALDVSSFHDKPETIVVKPKGAGSRSSRRVIVTEDNRISVRKEKGDFSSPGSGSDEGGSSNKETAVKNTKEGHLIVATLVATRTFAAAFTMPGGYISAKGRDQGAAVLTRKAEFSIFIVADSIAMLLSSLAVSIHILVLGSKKLGHKLFSMESYCITTALVAMMVAYLTGTYAVLSHSHPLAVTTCGFGSFCCCLTLTFYNLVKGPSPYTTIINPFSHKLKFRWPLPVWVTTFWFRH